MLTRVNDQFYMIIIIFILTLTRINGQLDLWPEFFPGPTLIVEF
jgi:hypothetical protein